MQYMDLTTYGDIKHKTEEYKCGLDYFTWGGSAYVGYIYARATPRGAGRIKPRCSNPRGFCFWRNANIICALQNAVLMRMGFFT